MKHFEEYKPSSFNDVLVNRIRENANKERLAEEAVFLNTAIPLHYWKRSDPEDMMDEK